MLSDRTYGAVDVGLNVVGGVQELGVDDYGFLEGLGVEALLSLWHIGLAEYLVHGGVSCYDSLLESV